MGEENSIIELTVPAGDVDDAVGRVCDEWGVERDAVQVDQLDAPPGQGQAAGRVHLRITLLEPGSETDLDADVETEVDSNVDPELQQGRQVLEDLLERMHLTAQVQASRGQPETEADAPVMVLDVQGDDLDPLIGRRGETLAALQYITRLILSKQFGHSVDLVVDVQGHKQRRDDQLRRMARRMAEQAAERQRVMTLEPMPANERRIIHLELRDHPDVVTESVGEGTHRKVTIIPRARQTGS
jgi:spoIIIJ-associated protein